MPKGAGYSEKRTQSKRKRDSLVGVTKLARAIIGNTNHKSMSVSRPVGSLGFRTGGWSNPTKTTELKYIDVTVATTVYAIAGTATLTLLNGVIQGSDATQRIGRKIVMKKLVFKGGIKFNGTTATTNGGAFTRTMIVYDAQTNATAPIATDILTADNAFSLMNLNNRDRFRVIYDDMRPFDNFGTPESIYNWYRTLNHEVIFNAGNAGTVGDIAKGALYLVTWLDSAYTVAAPLSDMKCRIRFSDD